jgi:hypothetical protein
MKGRLTPEEADILYTLEKQAFAKTLDEMKTYCGSEKLTRQNRTF